MSAATGLFGGRKGKKCMSGGSGMKGLTPGNIDGFLPEPFVSVSTTQGGGGRRRRRRGTKRTTKRSGSKRRSTKRRGTTKRRKTHKRKH